MGAGHKALLCQEGVCHCERSDEGERPGFFCLYQLSSCPHVWIRLWIFSLCTEDFSLSSDAALLIWEKNTVDQRINVKTQMNLRICL